MLQTRVGKTVMRNDRLFASVTMCFLAAWSSTLMLPTGADAAGAPLGASPVASVPAGSSQPWPHTLTMNGATVVVYQPQAIAWVDHQKLTTREAIAITPRGAKQPMLGTTEISFSTHTDAATDMVSLTDAALISSHFPSLDTAAAAGLEAQIKAALPGIHPAPVPLQSILLSLEQQQVAETASISNDPPKIFYSSKPASLVVFDGDPVLVAVDKTDLSYAVNTNWNIFTDGKNWFLLNDGMWMQAPAYTGPYEAVSKLPAAFSSIPTDPDFVEVHKALPPPAPHSAASPAILVSTKPAEIIVTDGAPQFAPVAGTGLQVVKNTSSVLYFQPSSGQFFLLISGRWFSAHGLDGPWVFASNTLPPDFALIPPDGPQASVLPSVPGTAQAQLAVLQAQVPRQATLKKASAKLTVTYAGAPDFRPIPGTTVRYAVNTRFEVIEAEGKFYVCYQGAWFVGASPNGPWVLAARVPKAIYAIPPTSPLYNVTYVKVYDATPTAVTFGYTAGYMMGFVTAGALVYGTGYYYPPVVIPGRVPVYYSYPYSYAAPVAYNTTTGAWVSRGAAYGPYGGVATGGRYYNPSNGAYGRGGSIYGPNGGISGVSYYNPSTGGYARGSASWNASGGAAQGSFYNPHTGVSGTSNQNWNAYSRWGSSTLSGPNQTVNTQSGSNARGSAGGFTSTTGAQGAGYRGVNGNRGGAVRTQGGDVYAGHDGNAYQHSATGWSKWSNGGWQQVNPPANGNGARTNATTEASAHRQQPGNRGSYSGGRQTMDTSSFQQLEQDRQARFANTQQRLGSAGRGGFGSRFGDGRFHR
jgi:hypothetical protein